MLCDRLSSQHANLFSQELKLLVSMGPITYMEHNIKKKVVGITITPTKAEDTIPACYVAPPVGEQTPTPLGQQENLKVVGEHLGYRIDEVLGARRDFLFQTPKPGLKEYGGNS